MAKWFGAHYNQEVRFSSAQLNVRKDPIRCLIKDEIVIIITITTVLLCRTRTQFVLKKTF